MDASTLGIDEQGAFWEKVKPYIAEALQELQQKAPKSNVIVAESDPMRFLGALFAGILNGEAVFLANKDWSYATWEQFKRITKGGYAFRNGESKPYGIEIEENRHLGYIMIPTGGSTGGVKLVIHDWENLKNSAKGTQAFLGGGPVNSACLLPLYHVSGLMQAVRAAISGGNIAFIDNKSIKTPEELPRLGEGYVTSLVPTQLGRLLQSQEGEQWLKQFDCIFLGGAKTDETLLKKARAAQLKISICYGATETASMATAMKPEIFLRKGSGVGEGIGDFRIHILNTKKSKAGKLKITGLVYKGYYPNLEPTNTIFRTHDRGTIDADGSLIILGREDNIIKTGGEKVDAEEVADAIRTLSGIKDVFVFGIQDPEWGEKVVALVAGEERTCHSDTFTALLKEKLERHKIPKEWVYIESIPLNGAGKVDRAMACRIVLENRTEQSGSLINLKNSIAARNSQLNAMMKALLNGKSEITLEIGCGHGDYLTAYGRNKP